MITKRRSVSRMLCFAGIALLLLATAGCMYPDELRKQNTANPAEYIAIAQAAIDQYKGKTGVLPIKNYDENTPLYDRNRIDFKKLQDQGLLSSPPLNSFESGGIFIYEIVNPDIKPEVKLLEVQTYQSAGDVQAWVDDYKKKHGGQLPKGSQIAPYFYYVNFEKIGKKPPEVKSVYNRQSFINYIVHESGQVAIDYAPDIMMYMKAKGISASPDPSQDLRELLVQNSYFVPGKSFAYKWQNGQPVPYLQGY